MPWLTERYAVVAKKNRRPSRCVFRKSLVFWFTRTSQECNLPQCFKQSFGVIWIIQRLRCICVWCMFSLDCLIQSSLLVYMFTAWAHRHAWCRRQYSVFIEFDIEFWGQFQTNALTGVSRACKQSIRGQISLLPGSGTWLQAVGCRLWAVKWSKTHSFWAIVRPKVHKWCSRWGAVHIFFIVIFPKVVLIGKNAANPAL